MRKILKYTPQYFDLRGERIGPLHYGTITLPGPCNYRCKKCFVVAEKRSYRPPFDYRHVVSMFKEAGVRVIFVNGVGEPLLSPYFDDVLTGCQGLGLATVVFTNASRLTPERIQQLAAQEVVLAVSLDSLREERYDELVGVPGAFRRVIGTLEALRSTYRSKREGRVVSLAVDCVVGPHNVDEVPGFKRFLGEDFVFIQDYLAPVGNGARASVQEALSGQNAGDAYRWYRNSVENSETGGHTCMQDGKCALLTHGLSIDFDGCLLPCGHAGDLNGLGANIESLDADELQAERARIREVVEQFFAEQGEWPCLIRHPNYERFRELYRGAWEAANSPSTAVAPVADLIPISIG